MSPPLYRCSRCPALDATAAPPPASAMEEAQRIVVDHVDCKVSDVETVQRIAAALTRARAEVYRQGQEAMRERAASLIANYSNGQFTDKDTWAEGFGFAKRMLTQNVKSLPIGGLEAMTRHSTRHNEPGLQAIDPGEISDGYHTFNELYEHRHALYLALCRLVWARHPAYHLPLERWDEAT